MLEAQRVHFIGIGGIGMSALAHILLQRGCHVSGSDQSLGEVTEHLAVAGARIHTGHAPEHVGEADLVVVTSAVRADNLELAEAGRRGLPVAKRADLLGALMAEKKGIAVAGTHGKTTTTWMVSHVLQQAGLDPSFAVGGMLPSGAPHGRQGTGEYFVAEADEYDGSFLKLKPDAAMVTNIEPDHLDFYHDIEDITAAFRRFLASVPGRGLVVLNADDQRVAALGHSFPSGPDHAGRRHGPRLKTYGLEGEADWRASAVRRAANGGSAFFVSGPGEQSGDIEITVPGRHNVSNALACVALCRSLGLHIEAIRTGLSSFQAVRRRFEIKGAVGGIAVVDDYAHHPSEITATLQAARQRFPGRRVWCVFQPHTYSRTKSLLSEFAGSLGQADFAVISAIYAAREMDPLGVTGEDIVKAMPGDRAVYIPDLPSVVEFLRGRLRAGDVLLTLGAGDVWRVAEDFLQGGG